MWVDIKDPSKRIEPFQDNKYYIKITPLNVSIPKKHSKYIPRVLNYDYDYTAFDGKEKENKSILDVGISTMKNMGLNILGLSSDKNKRNKQLEKDNLNLTRVTSNPLKRESDEGKDKGREKLSFEQKNQQIIDNLHKQNKVKTTKNFENNQDEIVKKPKKVKNWEEMKNQVFSENNNNIIDINDSHVNVSEEETDLIGFTDEKEIVNSQGNTAEDFITFETEEQND
eukprot:CAMPEP_0116890380 /NCGR_PEP_ID=MMETSP0467-20121206/912_1 /TAXON_ID=283647 /ORGANISM="Mesodinium pulex, Strain SPMC105" /LENGTH=225 /DNA_ID=CAMNT_0004558069 /DNA_START=112 /DNA_END=789 /DNA_ORIENTATION=+